jgi:polyisoprenoid-binding protein YceI
MKKIITALVLVLAMNASQAQTIVTSESKVAFVIKNLGIGVDGSFTGLSGIVKFDPKNLAASSFDVTVDANTINTSNKMRDDHLRKDEYFGVAKYKTIRLKSTKITAKGGNNYNFAGVITIKDKSFNITFDFTAIPAATGYVFNTSFNIDRRKFGVGGNSTTMSDLVKVKLNIKSK